jgi:hypothetical protein
MRSKSAVLIAACLLLVVISLSSSGRPGTQASVARPAEAASRAQDPIASLQAIQPPAARTRILVLATFHLRQIQKEFRPAMLDRLVAEVAAFRPEAVCIESLPGTRVREYELRKEAGPLYGGVLDSFGKRHLNLAKAALPAVKVTPEAAALREVELVTILTRLKPEERTAQARANLALWMAAAYDPVSAALQWSYLTAEEKKTQTAVPGDLAALLDAECAEVNEGPALALPLARRLGLQTVEPVDDFEDLEAYARIDAALEKESAESALLAAASKAPIYAESDALLKQSLEKGDLWPVYVFLNSPRYARADVDSQWGVFLRAHLPSGADRTRLGLWENRNLKIAARIRAAAALHPGGRILVIYGAAHKPFLDDYLSRMADVDVVQLDALKAAICPRPSAVAGLLR